MRDTPRRRSRPPSRRTGSSFPFIPVFIGVIVIGFVIGAGLSMMGKRGSTPSDAVAIATASPEPTLAPVTPAPTEKPTPEPTERASPKAMRATLTPKPSPAQILTSPTPEGAMSASVNEATTAPANVATAAPARPAASAASVVRARASATRLPLATARTPATPAATVAAAVAPSDAPAAADDADSEFGKLAAGVVRQYLAAVARGDTTSAYGALGQSSPGDGSLPESGVVDAATRIKHVEARGSGDAATVNVDLQTTKGLYFGQYTVHRTSSGAAIIVQHTLIRP